MKKVVLGNDNCRLGKLFLLRHPDDAVGVVALTGNS
jgi:hypothetical protein